MSKYDLTIAIEGKPGSGRTSAAILAERALINAGFNVEVDDMDIHQLGKDIVVNKVMERSNKQVFKGKTVKIKTIMVRGKHNE